MDIAFCSAGLALHSQRGERDSRCLDWECLVNEEEWFCQYFLLRCYPLRAAPEELRCLENQKKMKGEYTAHISFKLLDSVLSSWDCRSLRKILRFVL